MSPAKPISQNPFYEFTTEKHNYTSKILSLILFLRNFKFLQKAKYEAF